MNIIFKFTALCLFNSLFNHSELALGFNLSPTNSWSHILNLKRQPTCQPTDLLIITNGKSSVDTLDTIHILSDAKFKKEDTISTELKLNSRKIGHTPNWGDKSLINSPLVFLPYNGCGGGCASTNGRCCGTCSSSSYGLFGTAAGCPGDYACVKFLSLEGVNRYECWHYGPGSIFNGGKAMGVDIDSLQLGDCAYFKVFKQINTNTEQLLMDTVAYNLETTVSGWDPVIDTGFESLKYIFRFYTISGEMILTKEIVE